MIITHVIYDKEDENDYLEHITGRAFFDLNDGSKAVVRFLRDKEFEYFSHEYTMVVEQPKIPFFISLMSGKKWEWYQRVHRQLKEKVYDYIRNEYLAKMESKIDKDKIPPPPPKTGNIVKKGI